MDETLEMVAILTTVGSMLLGVVVATFAALAVLPVALRGGYRAVRGFGVRCIVGGLPLCAGFVVLIVGFFFDPLWPNQDETPDMHAYWLACKANAGRCYLVAAVVSALGLIGFVRTLLRAFRAAGFPQKSIPR